MSVIKQFIAFTCLIISTTTWAETISVQGTGKNTFYVYDEFERSTLGSSYTNKEVVLKAPATYVVKLNESRQVVSLQTGQNLVLKAGYVKVAGTGRDYFYVYDSLGNNNYYSSSHYTNKEIELLAGTYTINLNRASQKAVVQAGQTTVLETGSVSVEGIGLADFSILNKTETYSSNYRNVNAYAELFPNEYLIQVNNVSRPVTIVANQRTTLKLGSVKVTGLGYFDYHVYDILEKNRLYDGRDINKEVEMFAGDYVIYVNGSKRTAKIVEGQQTELKVGALTVTGVGRGSYRVYDETGKNELVYYQSIPVNNVVELFEGTYTIYLNGTKQVAQVKTNQKTVIPSYVATTQATGGQYGELYANGDFISSGYFYEQLELFTGTYSLKINGKTQTIVAQSGTPTIVALNADVSTVTPTPTTPVVTPDGSTTGATTGTTGTGSTTTSGGTSTPSYNDGVTAGIAQCKANPSGCGISNQYDSGYQTAVKDCKANPEKCGISVTTTVTSADNNGSTQAGMDLCKADPKACGIVLVDEFAIIQTTMAKCKANPSSCGIILASSPSSIDTNGSTQTGMDLCKSNPSLCGISIVDEKKIQQATIEKCQKDPKACNINVNVKHATYNPKTGEVYLPFLDVQLENNSLVTFELFLLQQTNSFQFDLDLTRIKQH